ncbi:MAG: filamentation induced by cAMP protein Fic [Microgenomates group bacterium Gr01-1014_5]|nr:MAG: filamentation induced by cAMP protein Fic [Microgenomates group bacterium Gr01-1014_5]
MNIINNRAGIYKKILSGNIAYKAFVPNFLPLYPSIKMDDTIQMLLSNADRAIGGLNIVTELLPDSDYFILSYLRKEATLSSQIEGTKATFIDVAKAEAGEIDRETPQDYPEIVNYINAINYGLKRIREDDFPMALRLLREIHERILKEVRGQYKTPGEFRKSQNWIGGASINTASYIPPTAEDMNAALDNLENFMNDKKPMPVLIRIGLIHSQFETIHPFLDGNGRVGRLMITLLLCHYGLLPKPALYLSEYFKAFRNEYYDRLNAVHEKGDFEGWLKYFLEGVWLVAEEATSTAMKIKALKDRDIMKLSGLSAQTSRNAIKLLENLFSSPIMTVKDVSKYTGLSYANANNLVKKLIDLKILEPLVERKRNRVFAYSEYMNLFKNRESYKRQLN